MHSFLFLDIAALSLRPKPAPVFCKSRAGNCISHASNASPAYPAREIAKRRGKCLRWRGKSDSGTGNEETAWEIDAERGKRHIERGIGTLQRGGSVPGAGNAVHGAGNCKTALEIPPVAWEIRFRYGKWRNGLGNSCRSVGNGTFSHGKWKNKAWEMQGQGTGNVGSGRGKCRIKAWEMQDKNMGNAGSGREKFRIEAWKMQDQSAGNA